MTCNCQTGWHIHCPKCCPQCAAESQSAQEESK